MDSDAICVNISIESDIWHVWVYDPWLICAYSSTDSGFPSLEALACIMLVSCGTAAVAAQVTADHLSCLCDT